MDGRLGDASPAANHVAGKDVDLIPVHLSHDTSRSRPMKIIHLPQPPRTGGAIPEEIHSFSNSLHNEDHVTIVDDGAIQSDYDAVIIEYTKSFFAIMYDALAKLRRRVEHRVHTER